MAFVQASGKRFTLNGQTFRPFGGAIYGGWDNDFLDHQFYNAAYLNLNTFRLVNWMSGAAGTDEYAEATWTVMDHALAKAREVGMKILIDFSDFATVMYNRVGNFEDQDWSSFVSFVFNRVNTENGLVYKNDDAIGFISIAGEVNLTDSRLVTFYTNVSKLMQAADTNHLIGFGGLETHHPWLDCINIPTIDYGSCHPYNGSLDFRFALHQTWAASANKPWFAEEVGFPLLMGDKVRAREFRILNKKIFQYDGAGLLIWNLYMKYNDVSESFNVNYDGIETFNAFKELSFVKSHSPRITVDEVTQAANLHPAGHYYKSFSPYDIVI